MPETSLGRIFEGLGVPNWEEIFPKKICEKCVLRDKGCLENQTCAALKTIGGLAVIITVKAGISSRIFAIDFIEDLKKTLNI